MYSWLHEKSRFFKMTGAPLTPEGMNVKLNPMRHKGRSDRNAGVHRRLRRFGPSLQGELRRGSDVERQGRDRAFQASGGLNASDSVLFFNNTISVMGYDIVIL
jgi:hypothetical protein